MTNVVFPSRSIWGSGAAESGKLPKPTMRSMAFAWFDRHEPDEVEYWKWRMSLMLEDTPQIKEAWNRKRQP